MTDRSADRDSGRRVSPVLQFALLIAPVVMNGFLLVYALTGWVLEGRNLLNWSLEAPAVALNVGLGIVGFAVLLVGWTRWRGLPLRHPLAISAIAHGSFAIVLSIAIVLAAQR